MAFKRCRQPSDSPVAEYDIRDASVEGGRRGQVQTGGELGRNPSEEQSSPLGRLDDPGASRQLALGYHHVRDAQLQSEGRQGSDGQVSRTASGDRRLVLVKRLTEGIGMWRV